MFGMNEFYASASVLNNTNKKVVNISYLENRNDNNDLNSNTISTNEANTAIVTSDNDSIIKYIASDTNSNIEFTSTVDNMMNDMSIYNKKVENEKVKEAAEAKAKADAEATAKADAKAQEPQENEPKEANTSYKATFNMEATAYTGDTTTATGVTPVRNPNGVSTIPGYGEAIAADTGGAIKGHRIDLFLNSENECENWGRQNVTLYVLAYPGEW